MTPTTPPWRIAIRDVLLVAALVVGVVLGAVVLTSALPDEVQRLIFHTPLAIGVLLVITAWILWRIARQQPPPA
jgi:heme A synthase